VKIWVLSLWSVCSESRPRSAPALPATVCISSTARSGSFSALLSTSPYCRSFRLIGSATISVRYSLIALCSAPLKVSMFTPFGSAVGPIA
jgi:hypothetical protein